MVRSAPLLALVLLSASFAASPPLRAQAILHTAFHDSGERAFVLFDRGALGIQVIRFYEDGSLRETGFVLAGRRHGEWSRWTRTGRRTGLAYYRHGVRSGAWKIWDDSGRLLYELEYDAGSLIAAAAP